jgi:hypothetical protein
MLFIFPHFYFDVLTSTQRFATSSPLHRPDVLREGILAGGRAWTKLREQDSS